MTYLLVPHDEDLPMVGPFEDHASAVAFEKANPYLREHGGRVRWAETPAEFVAARTEEDE